MSLIFGLLFPRRCVGCGGFGAYFCPSCQQKIKIFKKTSCPVCAKSAVSGKTHLKCLRGYDLNGLINVFYYEKTVKKALLKLKYKYVTDLAEELIDLTAEALRSFGLSELFALGPKLKLVPVPLHPRRQRLRGFNQSALLGSLLAAKFQWQFSDSLLARRKHTKPQVKLKGEERQQNVKGAFVFSPEVSFDKQQRILLFDDVWTTGSTMKECGRVLKAAGAKEVWGLTLAR